MVYNDIKLAINTIKDNTKLKKHFIYIYIFTNENIKACFNHFDFKNKDVLSVLASSDQVFDMFLRGAKSIDTFDINPLCKYYFALKKAAILALDRADFINFFSYSNPNFLNDFIFKEISKNLKNDNYIFWETLFNHKNKDDLYRLFELDLANQTLYLSDNENYKLLQSKINLLSVRFTNCDIYDLINILDNKYDIIYLSNILGRLGFKSNFLNNESMNNFISFLNSLSKYLKDNGEIIANYFYIYSQLLETLKILRKNNIDVSYFEKIKFQNDEINKAGALIYRK